MTTIIRVVFVILVAAWGMLPAHAQTRPDGSVMVNHKSTTLETGGKNAPAIKLSTVQGGHPLIYTEAPSRDCYLYVSKHRQPVMGDGQHDTFSRTMALLAEDNNNRARFRALWCTTDTMRVCFDYDGDPEHDTCTQAKWWKLTDKDEGTYSRQTSEGTCPQDLSEIGMMTDAAFGGLQRSGICDASVIAGMRAYRQQVNKQATAQATEPPSSTAQVAEPSSEIKTIAPSQGAPKPAPAPSQDTNSASASNDDDSYSATICNDDDDIISVAYAWRARPGDVLRTLRGWRRINPGACSTLFEGHFGNYSNAIIYYRAEDPTGGYWAGDKDLKLCVPTTKFERKLRDGYKCKSGEELVTFGRVEITRDKPEYELTLH